VRAGSNCRSCGAPVRWAITSATGARMPLDTEATEDGNLGVVAWREDGHRLATPVVAVNPTSALTRYRYTSHFATCPHAASHRRQT